jgi:hypothetical protein
MIGFHSPSHSQLFLWSLFGGGGGRGGSDIVFFFLFIIIY